MIWGHDDGKRWFYPINEKEITIKESKGMKMDFKTVPLFLGHAV